MLYCWLYVFLNSMSSLLRQISGLQIDPAFILLAGCCVSVIYFHIVNIKDIRHIYLECWQYKKKWFFISVTVTVMWFSAIYAPSYIGASLYIFLFFTVLGLIGQVSFFIKQPEQDLMHCISLIGLIAILLFVLMNDIRINNPTKYLEGIAITIFGSISVFIYAKQSIHFAKLTSLKPSQILAVRFYLAIVISIFFVNYKEIAQADIHIVTFAMFTGTFCLIVPLYFSQKGILKVGAEMYAVICSFTPLITAIFEEIVYKNVRLQNFVIYFIYILFSLVPFLAHHRKKIKF